jgi:hypothetical protein
MRALLFTFETPVEVPVEAPAVRGEEFDRIQASGKQIFAIRASGASVDCEFGPLSCVMITSSHSTTLYCSSTSLIFRAKSLLRKSLVGADRSSPLLFK